LKNTREDFKKCIHKAQKQRVAKGTYPGFDAAQAEKKEKVRTVKGGRAGKSAKAVVDSVNDASSQIKGHSDALKEKVQELREQIGELELPKGDQPPAHPSLDGEGPGSGPDEPPGDGKETLSTPDDPPMEPPMISSSGNKTRGTNHIDVTWREPALVPVWTTYFVCLLLMLVWAILNAPRRTAGVGIPLWAFISSWDSAPFLGRYVPGHLRKSPYELAVDDFYYHMWSHGFWSLVIPTCLVVLEWVHPLVFRTSHRYVFVRDIESPDLDLRADQISLSKLKHRPAYCEVRYFRSWLGFEYGNRLLVVSHELLAQICTARNMPSGADPKIVRNKLELSSSSLSTVNLNRYDSPLGRQAVQNTQRLAFGLWMEMEQNLSSVPFPNPPVAK